MGLNCVHWSPDLDVAGSTSVKQGMDEKFQDRNMSGGFSQSQPWGREEPRSHVQQTCLLTPPKPKVPACLFFSALCYSAWHWTIIAPVEEAWKLIKKSYKNCLVRRCPSVLWSNTQPRAHASPAWLECCCSRQQCRYLTAGSTGRQQSSLTHQGSTNLLFLISEG